MLYMKNANPEHGSCGRWLRQLGMQTLCRNGFSCHNYSWQEIAPKDTYDGQAQPNGHVRSVPSKALEAMGCKDCGRSLVREAAQTVAASVPHGAQQHVCRKRTASFHLTSTRDANIFHCSLSGPGLLKHQCSSSFSHSEGIEMLSLAAAPGGPACWHEIKEQLDGYNNAATTREATATTKDAAEHVGIVPEGFGRLLDIATEPHLPAGFGWLPALDLP